MVHVSFDACWGGHVVVGNTSVLRTCVLRAVQLDHANIVGRNSVLSCFVSFIATAMLASFSLMYQN